ncbi:metallophosphoesterase [Amylibacter sp. IMCC11727]|uniref:metallophosphoesterase n=1 Tax=Amylibacter sp. IMCC11727 TaxID=3039851 RepID=UPI00244DF257|nr:metallophosphoesterase [Amylibacter sp. IMCC11727]WGI22509.1 metallophosphoesterase [Amylibacter sp. IMCC11727]
MTTLYAIGDIHGDMDQLSLIHDRISTDLAAHPSDNHHIIHVGDLVDRRFHSKEVIDFLIAGQSAGKPWTVLKGNHDRMMTLFLDHQEQDPILRKDLTWLHPRLGGLTTLESYGITGFDHEQETEIRAEAIAKVPTAHRDYLRKLPDHLDTPRAFFAHAGVNPEKSLADQTEDDLIWVRAPFHDHPHPYEKLIVHGHTPVDVVTRYANNRINIDTGAAYGKLLSAIVLDDTGIWQLNADGRGEILVSDEPS